MSNDHKSVKVWFSNFRPQSFTGVGFAGCEITEL
jgi:hypothetical protein